MFYVPKSNDTRTIEHEPKIDTSAIEIKSLKEQLAQKEDTLALRDFEIKEKELTVKQLKGQLFDKECKVRDLNA